MSTPEHPQAPITVANDTGPTTAADASLARVEARLQALEYRVQDMAGTLRRTLHAARSRQLGDITAADGRHADPLSLTRSYAQVYSQNGEDGMLAEIFRRIGTGTRRFVEIGIQDGRQCNTRLLLESGWTGTWLEGDPAQAARAIETFRTYIDNGRLAVLTGMVTPANVEAALDRAAVPDTFDLLSLDIDQHTHAVLRALRRRARVVCVEYNASIPPSLPLEVPYRDDNAWDGSNWFGAGLKTFELIGRAQHLALVGCDMTGANAFLVDETEAEGRFRAPFTAEHHYQPPAYPLLAHAGHPPSSSARAWVVAPEAQNTR